MAAESGQGGNGTILFGCRVPPGGLPRAKPEPAAGPTAAIVMMSRPLCGDCMDLWEPPWYPNNRQRAELYLLAVWRTHPALRVVARSGVASYLADLVMP